MANRKLSKILIAKILEKVPLEAMEAMCSQDQSYYEGKLAIIIDVVLREIIIDVVLREKAEAANG